MFVIVSSALILLTGILVAYFLQPISNVIAAVVENRRFYDAVEKWKKAGTFSMRMSIVFFALLISVVMWLLGSIAIVPIGHSGIVRGLGGKILPYSLSSGFHLEAPWRTLQDVDIRRQVFVQDYEGSSLDQQTVNVRMFIVFKMEPDKVHQQAQKITGDPREVVLRPIAQDTLKAELAKYSVGDLLLNREKVNNSIETTLQEKLDPYYIEIRTVSIGDVSFSSEFEIRIEDKQVKEQVAMQAELEQQLAERLAVIAKITAKGEADKEALEKEGKWEASFIVADATATAERVIAFANADGNKLVQDALAKSNLLVQREFVRTWNGQLPTYQMGNSLITPLCNNVASEISQPTSSNAAAAERN